MLDPYMTEEGGIGSHDDCTWLWAYSIDEYDLWLLQDVALLFSSQVVVVVMATICHFLTSPRIPPVTSSGKCGPNHYNTCTGDC